VGNTLGVWDWSGIGWVSIVLNGKNSFGKFSEEERCISRPIV
jgi:hypothetical protein